MVTILRMWSRLAAMLFLLANAQLIMDAVRALPDVRAKCGEAETGLRELDFGLRRLAARLECHERAMALRDSVARPVHGQHRKVKHLRSLPDGREAG